MRIFCLIIYTFVALTFCGCFTGIESTPRITSSDVKKQNIKVSDEQKFLKDINLPPISQWQRGKLFLVSDPKIDRILASDSGDDAASLVGHQVAYDGVRRYTSVMGEDLAVVDFVADNGRRYYYKTEVPFSEIMSRDFFDLPFAVDLDVVSQVKERINGKRYFIISPLWYDVNDGEPVHGLRQVPVDIVDVLPGNSFYPVRVLFRLTDSDHVYAVNMTTGDRHTSTRNFETIFAFDDPRQRYPNISDEDWSLIVNSRVKIGMSRDECRLALGAPTTIGQRPTRAGMVEYWSFADGIYLIFEDGLLSSFRR